MFLIIFLEFMYVCINVYFNLNCGFFYVDVEDLFVFVIYLEVYIVFGQLVWCVEIGDNW